MVLQCPSSQDVPLTDTPESLPDPDAGSLVVLPCSTFGRYWEHQHKHKNLPFGDANCLVITWIFRLPILHKTHEI